MSTLENIKALRERTGAGMVDCKNAWEEARGDMEAAVEILRKKGIAKAAKRGERETSEGLIAVSVSDSQNQGYILEVDTETDFVARNEKFRAFVGQAIELAKKHAPADLEALKALAAGEGSLQEALENLSGTIGEKMSFKRYDTLSSQGTVAAYSHMGGKIGVLAAVDQPDRAELARELAMQVAAADPDYVKPEDIPAQELEKEKNIYREQLREEGKGEEIIEKIIEGKINKYCEEVALLEQEYIKDDKKKVKDILDSAKIEKFIRYSLN